MKHEQFEIFKVWADNINSKALEVFLNSGNIVPKSISVDKWYNNQKLILVGYVERTNETPHKYELVERSVDVSFEGLKGLGALVAKAAREENGVVCQDIEYTGGIVKLTFLVTLQDK